MIVLTTDSPVPPAEQIRTQVADLVRSGGLAAGERLPAIRQLAGDLGVAPGTVAKAYSALESEGLLVTGRARGTRVAADATLGSGVRAAADEYVSSVGHLNLDQALSAVRAAWPTTG